MNNWLEKVHALADGELSAQETAEVEAFIASSSEAKREYEAVLYLKRTLKAKLPVHDSAQLFDACRLRLDEIQAAQSTGADLIIGKFRYAFVTAVAAVILFGGVIARLHPATEAALDSVSRTLTASAADTFGFRNPSEDISTRWASEQIGSSVTAPSVTSYGLQLLRVDIVQTPDSRVIRYIYTDGRARYALCVFPRTCPEARELIPENGWMHGTNGQLNFVGKIVGDYVFILAAPRPFGELEAMLPQ